MVHNRINCPKCQWCHLVIRLNSCQQTLPLKKCLIFCWSQLSGTPHTLMTCCGEGSAFFPLLWICPNQLRCNSEFLCKTRKAEKSQSTHYLHAVLVVLYIVSTQPSQAFTSLGGIIWHFKKSLLATWCDKFCLQRILLRLTANDGKIQWTVCRTASCFLRFPIISVGQITGSFVVLLMKPGPCETGISESIERLSFGFIIQMSFNGYY